MDYRLLGSTGCAVSALALGGLTFGNETSGADCFAQLDRFTSAGGTLIDTADVYADGRSEQIIGRWLAGRPGMRDLVVIATKARFPTDESPNERGHLERNWQIIDAVRKVAGGRDVSMSQVAIAWLLGRPAVSSVILGARTPAQLEDNMAAAALKLTEEEIRLLDEASDPGAPDYPYGARGQTQCGRRISGGRF